MHDEIIATYFFNDLNQTKLQKINFMDTLILRNEFSPSH